MSDAWFYLPSIASRGHRLTLDERESRHASGARRLREGERITVFDGRGHVAAATIIDASGRSIEIELGESHIEPPFIPEIHLAVALPKGDRQSVMLNMAVQLGIAALTPILCERSVVKPSGNFANRAARIMLEACKQSRQARLPTIHEPKTMAEALDDCVGIGSVIMLAHPIGIPIRQALDGCTEADRITIMIGPEGGFTEDEVDQARAAGAITVDLGRAILRTETAAVALISALRFLGGSR